MMCPICGEMRWLGRCCYNCGYYARRSSSAEGGCIQTMVGLIILLWLIALFMHAH